MSAGPPRRTLNVRVCLSPREAYLGTASEATERRVLPVAPASRSAADAAVALLFETRPSKVNENGCSAGGAGAAAAVLV